MLLVQFVKLGLAKSKLFNLYIQWAYLNCNKLGANKQMRGLVSEFPPILSQDPFPLGLTSGYMTKIASDDTSSSIC